MYKRIVDPSYVTRGNNVVRYHAEYTLQTQTVGQHVANMMGILYCLPYEPSNDLIYAIVTHDIAEQYTGDIPHPFKKADEDMADRLAVAELEWMQINLIEMYHVTQSEAWLLRWLDIMEMIYFCRTERSMGNTLIDKIAFRAIAYLQNHMNSGVFNEFSEEMQEELDKLVDNVTQTPEVA